MCTPPFKDRCSPDRKTLRNGSLRRWSALAQGACFELSIQRAEANALHRLSAAIPRMLAIQMHGSGLAARKKDPGDRRRKSKNNSVSQRGSARIAIPRPFSRLGPKKPPPGQRFFIARAFRAFPVAPGPATTAAGGVCTTGADTGCTEAAVGVGTGVGGSVERPAAGAAVTGVRFVVSMGFVLFECLKRRSRGDPG